MHFYSMNKINKKNPQKTREQHIEDVLIDLEKSLPNFQLTIQKKDKAIQEYVRLLNLTKLEYQKPFQENKILKEKINSAERKRII